MAAKKKSPKKPQERNLTRELSLLLAKILLPDLQARAQEPSVARALAAQYDSERKHTADSLPEWTTRTLEQVAVAWILSCVFIRTLEDRGYLTHPRLAGDGAADSEHLFFDLFPSLTQRDYLLAVFRELSHLPGGEEVLAPKHNPAWRLAPTTEAVRTLLIFFQEVDSEGKLIWSFAGESTRFLGDLYQDVSEAVRERYALLQTPDFVEEFILDLTLDPAVVEFGLEEVRLIDPTCGSGHFLLGAFKRLLEARQRKAPATAAKEHAGAALAQVYGADINPYAVAIARFRLVLAYLQAAGIERLKAAPRISTNVVVADSLLFAADNQTLPFAAMAEDATTWGDRHWQFEEPKEVQRIFGKRFHAVVGNPPYITCKDSVLREEYRQAYQSAAGKFALSAPFTERFFQLATDSGFVGMINGNNFMKREFGKALIEKVLPHVELTRVIDTAGAYIPAHRTPTVMVFGRNREPISDNVVAVLGKRGEPETPKDPPNGRVWSSIRDHFGDIGFENEHVTVAEVPRSTFSKHPWSLGGGGAAELKELIESSAQYRLGQLGTIGVGGMSNADDVFLCAAGHSARRGIAANMVRSLVVGEEVRDWKHASTVEVFFPYDHQLKLVEPRGSTLRFLWPYRTALWARATFSGGTYRSEGRPWWQWHQVTADRYRTPLTLAFAEVATHNHFVLDRGGNVFKQTAPIVKLQDAATEDDYLALLAYLNSSVACFWMKQVFQQKSSEANSDHPDAERNRYQHAGTQMGQLPIPAWGSRKADLSALARETLDVASRRNQRIWSTDDDRAQCWRDADALRERMVVLQEQIDWIVYELCGLASGATPTLAAEDQCPRGARPFEQIHPRRSYVRRHNEALPLNLAEAAPAGQLSPRLTQLWTDRRNLILESDQLQFLERPLFKRIWRDTDENTDEFSYRDRFDAELIRSSRAQEFERHVSESTRPLAARSMPGSFDDTSAEELREVIGSEAVPFSALLTFSETGLVKRAQWERIWMLQRAEDAKVDVLDIPAPPKYDSKDFRDASVWRLRGKLDVPKERFISYPGAEKDDDKSPLFGWAGWDHLQRATALAGLYHERKTEDGWPADRLVPLLAGLHELVPWLKQWHNEPDDELGGEGPGDWYERYVEAESRSIGKTVQDLRDWRPAKGRGSKGA